MTSAKKACVIGTPIAHSRSPIIHNYWLQKYGIDGVYEKLEVTPEALGAFLKRVRDGEYLGCNVTIPLKEQMFDQVDQTDEQTRALKSVNTVFLSDGLLCGMSTDGPGFLASMTQAIPDWSASSKQVVILGAGGAARALVATFVHAGAARVIIVNRTVARAAAIASDYPEFVTVEPWDNLAMALRSADLLINATSLGMAGQPPLDISLATLQRGAVVADIVYAPLETALLRQAAEHDFRCVDGLGMLLHQAAPGFQKWFGILPEVTDDLRQRVVADIEQQ